MTSWPAASGNFSANTNETYANLLKAAVRHIGYAEVTAIEPKTLENMYAAMRKGDTTSGRPMSGTTLNALHKTISLVMDDLVEDGVLVENPCKKTATPPRDTEERRALKPERMRRLINELDAESEDENGYFLAITLGLRRAEVCGLSWEDVDFDGMVITIRRSYDHFGNLKSTKTRAGVRRLPMASFVARALARHREAQTRFLDALADKKDERFRRAEETPVMVNSKGLRTNPNNFAAHWRRDRKSLGVDGWCLHELRHSYLSMLALEGVHPKVMQDLAGHADSRTTMDIYTHVNMSQKRCAADALEAVMASAGPIEPRDPSTFRRSPSSRVRGMPSPSPSRPARPSTHIRRTKRRGLPLEALFHAATFPNVHMSAHPRRASEQNSGTIRTRFVPPQAFGAPSNSQTPILTCAFANHQSIKSEQMR